MNNLKHKITYAFSVLVLSVLSPDLYAQSVAVVPSQVWLTKLNQSVSQSPNDFIQATSINFLNNQVVSDQVTVSGQFKILQVHSDLQNGLLNADVVLNKAQAQVNNLQIHIVTQQDLGFGSATINLNAVCSSVLVSVKAAEQINVQIDRNFLVQHVQTNFDKLILETRLEGCNSMAGLQDEIQNQVLQVVKSQVFETQLKQILTDQISKQINQKVQGIAAYFIESKSQNSNVKLSLDQQNKLWVYLGESAQTAFTAAELAQLSQSDKPAALVRKDQLEKSLLANLNAQVSKSPIISKGNESLEKLTCSRFVQFFVWPALKAFPKCFTMQIISKIKDIKLTDVSRLKFTVVSGSWAQAKEPLKNIAYFTMNTDIALKPSRVRLNSFTGQHDPDFLKWSGRSSRISTGLMKSTLEDYLESQIAEAIKTNEMLNPSNINNIKLLNNETLFVQLKQ